MKHNYLHISTLQKIVAAVSFSLCLCAPSFVRAQAWMELGTGSNALNANASITTVCTDPSGNVYASGNFTDGAASYLGHRYVAKWNGATWGKLGTGVNALNEYCVVSSMCSDASGNIYAAGVPVSGGWEVAKWNGSTWSDLGGVSNALHANNGFSSICVDAANNVYVAGYSTDANGWFYVAKWNGVSWSKLGIGFNAHITAICTDRSGNVYAAGDFVDAYGKYYVAKWNGSTWIQLGLGFNDILYDICTDPAGNVYATGLAAAGVFKWSGTAWNMIGGYFNDNILKIASDPSGTLYAGGAFDNSSYKNYVARFSGLSWTEMGVSSDALNANGNIAAICPDTHGNVYAAGSFKNNDGNYYVAKYNTKTAVQFVYANENRMRISPNPATGNFTIEIPKPFITATLMIKDIAGRIVQSKNFGSVKNKEIMVELKNAPIGSYLIQVITNDETYREQIMIR